MDGLYVPAEAVHIIQVGVYSIKALYTCCTGCDDRVLAGTISSRPVPVMWVCKLCIVTAGKSDAKHPLRCFADIQSLHNTSCRLDGCHDQCMAFRNAVLLLCTLLQRSPLSVHSSGAFCLWDTDGIVAACYCTVDIFFPVWVSRPLMRTTSRSLCNRYSFNA